MIRTTHDKAMALAATQQAEISAAKKQQQLAALEQLEAAGGDPAGGLSPRLEHDPAGGLSPVLEPFSDDEELEEDLRAGDCSPVLRPFKEF